MGFVFFSYLSINNLDYSCLNCARATATQCLILDQKKRKKEIEAATYPTELSVDNISIWSFRITIGFYNQASDCLSEIMSETWTAQLLSLVLTQKHTDTK